MFQDWNGLDDCAHYVSQCLRAGSAGIETQWGARELKEALQQARETKTLMERGSGAIGQQIVDAGLLKRGDAIIYYNKVPSEGSHVGYHHSAMYVGDSGITCHSTCRYKGLPDSSDDDWDLGGGAIYEYTFIHFSGDDVIAPHTAKKMAGWWKVAYPARTSFYAVLGNGTVRSTTRAPRKSSDTLLSGPSAYWFEDSHELTIRLTWKGSLNRATAPTDVPEYEEWIMDRGDNTVRMAKLNGMPGKVEKLF